MGPVDTVADHYSDYVNMLNAMKGKEKQEFLDKKFQKRLLPKQEKGLFQKLFG